MKVAKSEKADNEKRTGAKKIKRLNSYKILPSQEEIYGLFEPYIDRSSPVPPEKTLLDQVLDRDTLMLAGAFTLPDGPDIEAAFDRFMDETVKYVNVRHFKKMVLGLTNADEDFGFNILDGLECLSAPSAGMDAIDVVMFVSDSDDEEVGIDILFAE